MNRARRERGVLWQGRFFDPAPLPLNIFVAGRRRALRTVKEYNEKVEYIHLNPVKAGLVKRCRQTQEFLWRKRHATRGLAVVERAGVYGKRERAGEGGTGFQPVRKSTAKMAVPPAGSAIPIDREFLPGDERQRI